MEGKTANVLASVKLKIDLSHNAVIKNPKVEKMKKLFLVTVLASAGSFVMTDFAVAQVAGASTSVGVNMTESTQVALGWSVKKTILGKMVYTDTGEKIGKVEDLIIATDKHVSYVIIAAGGFVGIGTHNVAIPVSQIQNQAGKLVMPGATRNIVKSLPRFDYADNTARRDEFVAKTELDLTKAKNEIAVLQKKAAADTTEAKAALDIKISASQLELKATEAKLTEMKNATATRWKEFEAGVSAANERLRKSLVLASV
jgi:sporulation protein YlmC with PRC-barrel domain